MKHKLILMVSIILIILVTGCTENSSSDEDINQYYDVTKIAHNDFGTYGVYRFHDSELNNTVYIYNDYNRGGIFVVSNSQLEEF